VSGVLDAPKKSETPLAVPEKRALVEKVGPEVGWPAAHTRESQERNVSVAALEEVMKALERKADERQERVREDLKALGQVVREAVEMFVRRGQEDGAVIAAQRETVDRWKQEAGAAVEELRQCVSGLTVASDGGVLPAAKEKPEKRPAVKKKLETAQAVPEKAPVAEKVVPGAEAEGVVLAVDDATQVAEGSASSSLISKGWHVPVLSFLCGYLMLLPFTKAKG
jgi:hypothetical protein